MYIDEFIDELSAWIDSHVGEYIKLEKINKWERYPIEDGGQATIYFDDDGKYLKITVQELDE